MKNLILPLNMGKQGFNDFVKYLFSCSKAHTENDETKNNFYVKKDPEKNVLNISGFVTSSEEKYKSFVADYGKEIKSYTKFKNDLFYIFFAVIHEDALVTNIFTVNDEDEIELSITSELFDAVVENYFNGEEEIFYSTIKIILDRVNSNNLSIINLEDATLEQRKTVEKLVHLKIMKENEAKTLIQISHHDQVDHDIFHVHRLIRES